LHKQYSPDARYNSYKEKGTKREYLMGKLPKHLPEELHNDKDEHEIADNMGEGVLCKIYKMRGCLY